MSRGRKPKPKQQLRLAGTDRADRHGRTPDPSDRPPEMPEWITGRAAELWPEVCGVLRSMRLLSVDYTVGIALLVDAMADWIHYSRLIADDPEHEHAWRWEKRKREAWADVYRQHREFGMSPSSMRGIEVPEEHKDELDALLA